MLLTLVPMAVFMYNAMISMLAIIGMGLTVFGIIEIVKKTKNRNFIPTVLSIAFVIIGIASIVSAIVMLPDAIEATNEITGFLADFWQ